MKKGSEFHVRLIISVLKQRQSEMGGVEGRRKTDLHTSAGREIKMR